MKIYDTPQQLSAVASGKQAHRTDGTTSSKPDSKRAVDGARGDEVHLSAPASGEPTSAAGANREERIAELASLYGRGAYAIDAEAVASGIIDDATRMP